MRSGIIYTYYANSDTSGKISEYGYDWARFALEMNSSNYIAGSNSVAHNLYFPADAITYSLHTDQRFGSIPLRCLSTAVEGEESVCHPRNENQPKNSPVSYRINALLACYENIVLC